MTATGAGRAGAGPAAVQGSAGAGPAIVVTGLTKRYGGRTVLDGVSLSVERGELVALLGPNGAGKTTTVEVIEGYRQGDGGEVRVLGQDPRRGGPALRARVGLMLQGGGIDPRAEPRETLVQYGRFHEQPRDADELLRLVGLETVARTRFRRLSGGERQRLGLALALVGRPEVVVLDEPTAGMDPEARAATRAIISALRADGVAILLTSHDLTDVERLADRVCVLDRGRIVAAGTVAELATGAQARLRFRLASALDAATQARLGAALAGVCPGARVAVDDDAGAYRVDGAAPEPGLVATLAGWCAERGLLIRELRTSGGTLEEVYLELVAAGEAAARAAETGSPDAGR